MDTFKHPYYALNRRLLIMLGQWPWQSSNERRLRFWISHYFFYSFGFVEVAFIITSHGDVTAILEVLGPLSAWVICLIKYYTMHFNMHKIKTLLNRIGDNWKMWKSKEELDIMHEFAKEGKALTFWYTVYIYTCMNTFLVLPFISPIMDLIAPLNESRPLSPPMKCQYFIDQEKYFSTIYIHMCILIAASISVIVVSDTLFLLFNSHICGLFAALGNYLENTAKNQPDPKSSIDCLSREYCLKSVAYSVQVHNRALEFAELIESLYTIPLLLQAGLSLVCMSISLFQILMTLDRPSEAVRYVSFAAAQLVHLFCMCYPGQRMIDYSTQIQFKAYNGLWYKAPAEIHKLVLLIIQRSMEPCYLTAGKVFIFCLESYSTILQTATSYFMVLASFN